MKTNRLYFGITLLFVMLLSGCDSGGEQEIYPEFCGRWSIDNKTNHTFRAILTFDTLNEGDELHMQKIYYAKVEADTLSHITISDIDYENKNDYAYYQTWAIMEAYVNEDVVSISFEFSNGICHTFTGDRIACDVRDANNWVISTSELSKYYKDHVYTFTQEDYDEIMTLYE